MALLKALLDDWRALAIGAALVWGFWGVFAKVATDRLDWRTALLFVIGSHFTVTFCVTVWKANFKLSPAHLAAVAAGVCSCMGGILMYRALERADGGVVIAVSAQYVLATALLSAVFLHERLTPLKLLGLVCGVMAIILLCWEQPRAAERRLHEPTAEHIALPDGPPA
jgi:transporter family protein